MRKFGPVLGVLFLCASIAQAQWNTVAIPLGPPPTCDFGRLTKVLAFSDAIAETSCASNNFGATGNSRKVVVCMCAWTAGASAFEWQVVTRGAGGSGTPGGADTQVQYNDSGSFGGHAGLTFNETTNALTVSGVIVSARSSLGGATGSFAAIADGDDRNGDISVRAIHADGTGTSSFVGYSLQLGGTTASSTTDHTILYDATRSEFTFASGQMLGWSSAASNPFADADVSFTRNAAADIALNSGRTTNGLATLRLGEVRLTPQASPPVTCGDANTLGYAYADTSLALCFCDGTAWQVLNPSTAGVGTCS